MSESSVNASRYAIYLAPQPDSALWRFGSTVLGYDAATGLQVPTIGVGGFSAEAWRTATMRPRTYGFHGTLKAPFRLRDGATAAMLIAAMAEVAEGQPAFDAGPLVVTAIGHGMKAAANDDSGFVALTLQRPSPELAALENLVVERLDSLRAPLTASDMAARRPERLTERQRANLERWGYPFIGPDFAFHMTLSGALDHTADVADALADLYASQVGSAHLMVDALVLFEQPAPGAPFRIVARTPLRTAVIAR
jgi:2'-5' RNA ligase